MNSWKEIAAFFDKDVRTVRRWEAARKLPVRRVPGGGRSGVFAYVHELERWLAETDVGDEALTPEALATKSLPADDPVLVHLSVPPPDPASSGLTQPPAPSFARRPGLPFLTYLVPAGILLAALILFATRQTHKAPAQLTQTASSTQASLQDAPSSNPEALELYLRGLNLLNQRTAGSLTEAVDLFTQAIVHDPRLAPAYAGLADSYILLRQYGTMTDQAAFSRALTASRQSLALDDRSPEAHRTYAFLLNFWIWDFPSAEREFQRSLQLRPNDPQTHHWYATSLHSVGRYQDALREIDTARRLAPDSPAILANRGLILCAIDPHQGVDYLSHVARTNPTFPLVRIHLAHCSADLGDYPSFLAQFREASRLKGDGVAETLYHRAQLELAAHGTDAMLRMMGETTGQQVDFGRPDAMQPAFYFARLGDQVRTLHYLQLAGERHEANFLIMNQDPTYRFVRETPQFQDLLRWRNTSLSLDASLTQENPETSAKATASTPLSRAATTSWGGSAARV